MSDMNVIKGGRNCSGGMGVEVIIFISDIHESHMVPTPAAVLGVVIPYNSAWSLAWATSYNSAGSLAWHVCETRARLG